MRDRDLPLADYATAATQGLPGLFSDTVIFLLGDGRVRIRSLGQLWRDVWRSYSTATEVITSAWLPCIARRWSSKLRFFDAAVRWEKP